MRSILEHFNAFVYHPFSSPPARKTKSVKVLTAPIGVRLAHSLPVGKLKRAFAVLLLVVAIKMLLGLF